MENLEFVVFSGHGAEPSYGVRLQLAFQSLSSRSRFQKLLVRPAASMASFCAVLRASAAEGQGKRHLDVSLRVHRTRASDGESAITLLPCLPLPLCVPARGVKTSHHNRAAGVDSALCPQKGDDAHGAQHSSGVRVGPHLGGLAHRRELRLLVPSDGHRRPLGSGVGLRELRLRSARRGLWGPQGRAGAGGAVRRAPAATMGVPNPRPMRSEGRRGVGSSSQPGRRRAASRSGAAVGCAGGSLAGRSDGRSVRC